MGRLIEYDYRNKVEDGIVLVALLRGAATFSTDLARAINLPLELDYMMVSSYGNSTKSSGELIVKSDLDGDIKGKHVLIVEDIIDSGFTLSMLVPALLEKGAASVEIAVLLKKRDSAYDVKVKYVGFDCPDGFIVGYGLDYAGKYRNLPYIGVLKPEKYA